MRSASTVRVPWLVFLEPKHHYNGFKTEIIELFITFNKINCWCIALLQTHF
jgi:hypothetical protein